MQDQTGASTSKFQGEQDPRHAGRLYWPGYHGLPYRGPSPPLLNQRELGKLHVSGDFGFGTFDLSSEHDAEYYSWIRERVRNGWFTMDHIEYHWDDDRKVMVIYCEWTQLYVQLPPPSYTG